MEENNNPNNQEEKEILVQEVRGENDNSNLNLEDSVENNVACKDTHVEISEEATNAIEATKKMEEELKNKQSEEEQKVRWMPIGLVLGMSLGILLAGLLDESIPLWLTYGMIAGIIIGQITDVAINANSTKAKSKRKMLKEKCQNIGNKK